MRPCIQREVIRFEEYKLQLKAMDLPRKRFTMLSGLGGSGTPSSLCSTPLSKRSVNGPRTLGPMASCSYSEMVIGEFGESLIALSNTECLSISSWYRAKDGARRKALTNLC